MLFRGLVDCSVDGKSRSGRLLLTDRRVVLVPYGETGMAAGTGLFGFLGGMVGALVTGLADSASARMSHQIARDEFAVAAVTGRHELTIRSRGEGYAMTHFTVTTPEAAAWATRLTEWAAGVDPAH